MPEIPTVTNPSRYLRHAALLVALAAFGAAVLSYGGYLSMLDAVRRDAELSARGAAADVDRYAQTRWTTLQALAEVPAVRAADLPGVQAFLDDLDAEALGFGAGIAFIDTAGVLQARTGGPVDPIDLADREYVQRALRTGTPVASEVVAGRLTDMPVVSFLVPARDDAGRLVGLVGGGLRLDSMASGADSLRIAGGTPVVVIDPAGNLVTGEGQLTTLQPADPSLPVQGMRAQQLGSLSGATGPQGEPDQLIGYGLAPSVDWLVLVERPASDAFQPARGELGSRLAVIAVVASIAILILLWAERRVERSARAERATMERLQVAVGELERRERLREVFVSVMSHELRTPVTSIYAASKLLAKDPRRPELESLLGDIEEEAERLHRITEDLLVLSRAEHGRVELRPEPVLLQRIAPTVAAVTTRRYPGARITIDLPPGLPPVSGDPGAVRQILDNLLSNAAKYGHGSEITVRAEDRGRDIALLVEDGGPGLPEGERQRVFELFYRSGSNQRDASGTGIGLFVVSQLTASMGGTAVAEAREPTGLRVVVTLPAASAVEASPDGLPETGTAATGSSPGAPVPASG